MNICIIGKHEPAYSETFIRAHIEKLPGKISFLHGSAFPDKKEKKKNLLKLWEKYIQIFGRKFGKEHYFMARRALRLFLKNHKIDVVLAEYGHTGASIFNICEKMNIPLVVHFHGYDAYENTILDNFKNQYAEMFKKASAIIGVSKHMINQLKNLGAPNEKLFYNVYGVDTKIFKQAFPSKNPPVLLAVGRFVDKKAPFLTILAFEKVLKEIPKSKLKMIGDGYLLDTCKRLVKSLGISNSVDFLPPQPHESIAKEMNKARAFVQHSVTPFHGDSEGTPVSILEASVTGLPVISTYHAGIPDVIENEKSGLLVPEGDFKAMANNMLRILKNPKLAEEMGKYGRKKNSGRFSIENSINNLSEVLIFAVKYSKTAMAHK